MVDTSVIVLALKNMGHEVTDVIELPRNAGDWEFRVDGKMMTLVEVRELLEKEEGDNTQRTNQDLAR